MKIKRLFDYFILILIFPIVIFLFLLISLLIFFKLGKPILFIQSRIGLNGKEFNIIKFRTMRNLVDNDGILLGDKARLTQFGKLLRNTSLDEIPSLINVALGEMTLVGPRPLISSYRNLYTSLQFRRHNCVPGLTGWAQVNGRNAISWEEKFKLDVWYVDNQSFWLDMKILWLTIRKVLVREGINQDGQATMEPFKGSEL